MKALKVSFDFSDRPHIVEQLRVEAAKAGKTQKAILVEALEAFFANKLENSLLARAATITFAEWDNPEDSIYDTL